MNQDPRQSKVKRPFADQLRIAFPALIIAMFSMAAVGTIFATDGEIMTPEPSAIAVWAKVIGTALGVLSGTIVLGVRPRTLRLMAIAVVSYLVVSVFCWMSSWMMMSWFYQHYLFDRGNVKTVKKYVPILIGEINHYKGMHYQVWLKSYSALLEVGESDYVAAFGRAKYAMPIGYCVYVIVQTSGTASRVLVKRGMPLPAGSVERCPLSPKNRPA